MKTLLEKAEWVRASGYTRRYHGWRVLLEDPVGLHERNVAKLVQLIDPTCRKEVILYALGHDDAEWIVGDMPAPAKRRLPDYPEVQYGERVRQPARTFRDVFGEMEDGILAEAELPLPELTPAEHWLVKFCDSLDGLLYSTQEIAMGNTFAIPVWQAFESYLEKLLEEARPSEMRHSAHSLYGQVIKKGDYRGYGK